MVGQTLSHYEILEELGRGGMGIAYKAMDTKLERIVAIKILSPYALRSDADNQRFYREARNAAAINHPNVAVTHAVDEAVPSGAAAGDAPQTFIAMEFIDGDSLTDIIERRPISAELAIDITIQIAQGLKAAHDKRIIHRDIKSGNIMLTKDGLVKILDFGLAQKEHAQKITKEGATVGTAAYMSPEQSKGEELDHRTDIWSLGVILYELLTGVNPFRAHYDQAIIYAILNMNPQPISDVRDDVPEELEHVVSKMLEKTPDARYSSAEEIIEDLSAIGRRRDRYASPVTGNARTHGSSGSRVLSGTDTNVETAIATADGIDPRRITRNNGFKITAFIIALVVVVLVAQRRPGPPTSSASDFQRVAIFPFSIRGGANVSQLRTGMVDLLSTKLDGAGNWRSSDPRKILSSDRFSDEATIDPAEARRMAASFGAQLFVMGSVIEVGESVEIGASLYTADGEEDPIGSGSGKGRVDDLFGIVDRVASQLLSSFDNSLTARVTRIAGVTTSSIEAFKAYLDGEAAYRGTDYLKAAEGYQRATEIDSTFALAWYQLAKTGEWLLRANLTHHAAEKAVKYYNRLSDRDKNLLDAFLASKKGDIDGAVNRYQLHLQTYPDDAEARISLGEVLFHDGPYSGIPVSAAFATWDEILKNDPNNLAALVHAIRIKVAENQADEALALINRMLTLVPDGDRNPEVLLIKATLTGDREDRELAESVVRGSDDNILAEVGWLVMAFIDPTQNLDFFWETVLDPSQSKDVRIRGHILRAQDYLRRGKIDPASAQLEFLEDISESEAILYEALVSLLPLFRDSPDTFLQLRGRLNNWNPPESAIESNPISFYSAHDGLYPIVKKYLLGWVDLKLENYGAVEQAAAGLDNLDDSHLNNPIAAELAASLRANAAFARKDFESALELFQRANPKSWYQLRNVSPFYAGSPDRYLLARTFEELNDYDEALRLFDSFRHSSGWDQIFMAPGNLGRARIYVVKNEQAKANAALEEFFKYWDDVDERFGPLYDEARALQADLDLGH